MREQILGELWTTIPSLDALTGVERGELRRLLETAVGAPLEEAADSRSRR